MSALYRLICCFNTQPPEGGCMVPIVAYAANCVSTHSRLKAAAIYKATGKVPTLFQHTAA